MFTLLKAPAALDVIQTRGSHVELAVRTKVVNFPDNIRAVWVMVCSVAGAASRGRASGSPTRR